ncbi:MAG TPA: hypothetical protein VNP89_02865 [Gaiellaceae bacterium]|nr:hypothetical protein [Gaiellaceae bacterium]
MTLIASTAATAGGILFVVTLLLAVGASIVICAMKGKWGMVFGGVVLHLLWYVGAIRLAKPNSWWARRFYDASKLATAQSRHS